jgi:hypothetical protein
MWDQDGNEIEEYLDWKRDISYHEAGHAVIGRALGLVCGFATILPTRVPPWPYTNGFAQIEDPYTTASEWTYPDDVDPTLHRRILRAAFRGRIIACMAGAEAEDEFVGLAYDYEGDSYDRETIEALAAAPEAELSNGLWFRYEPRMRRQTRRLVRNHAYSIETVARYLLERKTLGGAEIDRIRNHSPLTKGRTPSALEKQTGFEALCG